VHKLIKGLYTQPDLVPMNHRVVWVLLVVALFLLSSCTVFATSQDVAPEHTPHPQTDPEAVESYSVFSEECPQEQPGIQFLNIDEDMSSSASARNDFDVAIDGGGTYYKSSGIPAWGHISLGQVNKTVEIHVKVRNKGNVPVTGINVTCTVYLWLDIGALNGGPIIFRESRITSVIGFPGALSGDIVFYWTPMKAQSHMINISVHSLNDNVPKDNEGWFYGEAFPDADFPRFLTGLFTNSWSNDGSGSTEFGGDLGDSNAWHIIDSFPVPVTSTHSGTDAWWCGNDTLGHCGEVLSDRTLITQPVSLVDYDPYAKNPEDPSSLYYEPQIYFDYKWAGNITPANGSGIYTYISTNGGMTWDPIVKDDLEQEKPATGNSWNESDQAYRWQYWVHTTKNSYKRTGIPIGDYVGKVVRFKLEYVPGNVSQNNDTGFFIDDLVVWGRQRMPFLGFYLDAPSNLTTELEWGEEEQFNFTLRNIEDTKQDIRVSLLGPVPHWEESINVVINRSLFTLDGRPGQSNVCITLKPSEMAPAGLYKLNITFVGSVSKTLCLKVTLGKHLNISLFAPTVVMYNNSGESPVFELLVTNWANIPPVVNITLGKTSVYFRVDLPEDALPMNYTYDLMATLNGTGVKDELNVTVVVKQFYDLALLFGNNVQEIVADAPDEDRVLEFPFEVSNKGNGNDSFQIVTTPKLEEDAGIVAQVDVLDGNTIVSNGVSNVKWIVTIPRGASNGEHEFEVKAVSPNGDIDWSDNLGTFTVNVIEPVVVDILNFTFIDSIAMDPPGPAAGQEVNFNLPYRNTGNTVIDLTFTVILTGMANETFTELGVEPDEELLLKFTRIFSSSGDYNLTIYGEMRSNITREFIKEEKVSLEFYVGFIDLAIESIKLYRGTSPLLPGVDTLEQGEHLTLEVNVTNKGDIKATDVQVAMALFDGNITIWEYEQPIFSLDGGGLVNISLDVEASNGTDIRIWTQVHSGMDYLEFNISNNDRENEYEIAPKVKETEIYLGTLLIIIAVVFFLMLVFIIFVFYSRRADAEEDEDDGKVTLDDDELDDFLDDDDLQVDFIDDEEE